MPIAFAELCGNESVRCAVEAVLSYVQLLIILVGKSEHISLFGHCLVECGIKYNYLRCAFGEYLLAGAER